MLGDHETIAAIGTAKGIGALGIVRISGKNAFEIISRCFDGAKIPANESHKAYYGVWKNPSTNALCDEVVVLAFAEGRGFTGEASADIICHGGVQVTELVLQAALDGGCRLARPGEFSYRAVMHGRLDLARAESILELIHAKTPRAAHLALMGLRGALSEKLVAIENELVFVLANLEASIDFTTEDIQPVNYKEMQARAEHALTEMRTLLKTYIAGKTISQGLRAVLAGAPNAGKSSLMNAVLGMNRSIVAPTPGTTRDTVEAEHLICGQLFRFIDTAGIRVSEQEIEKQGIDRALDEIKGADLVLYVVDSALGLSNEDVTHLKNIGPDRAVVAFNKNDVLALDVTKELTRFGLQNFKGFATSATASEGTKSLREALVRVAGSVSDSEMSSVLTTTRQKEALEGATEFLQKAIHLLQKEESPEFVSFELKESLTKVQETLGKNIDGDDIMDRVFKEFCIGK